jgi:hypothetical protein
MKIKDKRFPIKLDPKLAGNIFQTALKKKGHKIEIKKEMLYLTITPYWFCFYDILKNNNSNFKRVSDQIALNAINNQINEKVISIFKLSKPIIKEDLEAPKTEHYQINIKKAIISQKEAEKTIKKYLMYKELVDEEQISLSGIELIFVPNWKVQLRDYKLKIDAITGTVNNFEVIKEKEKTKLELIKEVFSDITEEKKVTFYISDFFKSIFQAIYFIFKELFKNYQILLWLIAIALFVYLLFL